MITTKQLKIIADTVIDVSRYGDSWIEEPDLCYVFDGTRQRWNPLVNSSQTKMVLEWLRKQTWFSIVSNPEQDELLIEYNDGMSEFTHKDFQTAVCMLALEIIETLKK